MPTLKHAQVLAQWLAAINNHDVAAIATLMAEDFVFVDSMGTRLQGGKAMEAGWRGYFALCPDYWIRADETLSNGPVFLIAGEAGGKIDGESWRIPAAWKAVTRDGQIVEWRVFADNKPVYEILGKRRR